MSSESAVIALFVAFGADRRADQARLYLDEVEREFSCGECVQLAAQSLMRTASRLPTLKMLLDETRDVFNSGAHLPHITAPQLAPKSETYWRSEAVKMILPFVKGDRNLASFIAAQMWFSDVPPSAERITFEMKNYPVWIEGARDFIGDKLLPPLVDVAFKRARWTAEHERDELISDGLLNLEAGMA